MLEVKNLQAGYRGIQALKGVSLSVAEGEMVALIGANGAGKSTLLNSLSAIVTAGSGQVLFDGQDITGWSAHRVARAGLLQVPEGRQVMADLTVREHLQLGAPARRPGNRSLHGNRRVALGVVVAARAIG